MTSLQSFTRIHAFLLAGACALAFTACDRWELTGASAPPLFDPPELDFGAVAVGTVASVELRVTNAGAAPLRLGSVAPSDPALELEAPEATVLAALESTVIRLRWTPGGEAELASGVEIATDDGGRYAIPVKGLAAHPRVEASPSSLDFGTVDLGAERQARVTVTNVSKVSASVALAFGGGAEGAFASESDRVDLAAGESRELPIAFRPSRPGRVEGHVALRACDRLEPQLVALAGIAVHAELEAIPAWVDFGRVPIGADAPPQQVKLVNRGSRTIAVGEVALKPAGQGFAIDSSAVPDSLAPGEGTVVDVYFSPTAGGAATASIEVATDGGPKHPVVTVSGEGGEACVRLVPEALEFADVAEGMSATRSIELVNLCDFDVTVIDAAIRKGDGGLFTLPELPQLRAVAPGARIAFPVMFTAVFEGASEASLAVTVAERSYKSLALATLRGTSKNYAPCAYQLSPSALQFGSVAVGQSAALWLTIANTGTEACFVEKLALAAGSDPEFTAEPVKGLVLPAGARRAWPVRFAPAAAGSFHALVEARVNHPTAGYATALVSGKGTEGSCFALDPRTLDFGLRGLSCPAWGRPLAAVNKCAHPVTVGKLSVDSPSGRFQSGGFAAAPLTLQPGQTAWASVSWSPVDEGEDVGTLSVTADGTVHTVGLHGVAMLEPKRIERFEQKRTRKVDVLWVIDNSASMSEEQKRLGAHYADFIATALKSGIDYHIGVTTTGLDGFAFTNKCPGGASGGESGRLFPVDGSSPRIITPATSNPDAVFANNVNVGQCHFKEQGIEAAYRALSSPLVDHADDPRTPIPADGNAGFLRPDARLEIVFVSDEEDVSPRKPEEYEPFFRGLKKNDPSLVSISAVVRFPPPAVCTTASSPGSRYIALAQAFGGAVESICDGDWKSLISNLSSSTMGPRAVFRLAEEPLDPKQIVVRIDGVVVTTGWFWDAAARAVRFGASSAPRAGSTVEIEYPVGCG